MDAKTEKKLREAILQGCEGSRQSEAFEGFNDDEYVGYQTAMTVANSHKINATVMEKFAMVKTLFKEGKL